MKESRLLLAFLMLCCLVCSSCTWMRAPSGIYVSDDSLEYIHVTPETMSFHVMVRLPRNTEPTLINIGCSYKVYADGHIRLYGSSNSTRIITLAWDSQWRFEESKIVRQDAKSGEITEFRLRKDPPITELHNSEDEE